MSKARKPDYEIKTPCGGPEGTPGVRWRVIGEAWIKSEDGQTIISCRIDLPPQQGRIILVEPKAKEPKP